MPDLGRLLTAELDRRQSQHLLRRREELIPTGPVTVRRGDRTLVNFASNNYLGLTHHPRLLGALVEGAQRYGTGAAAAPLISGQTPAHAQAEVALAAWKKSQAAVLLPSGYQAAHAAVQTLSQLAHTDHGARFLLDKLVHASLIDAVRASGRPWRVFPHNGTDKLHRLLQEAPKDQLQVVVTESIFSMDGDAADLPALAWLKQEHGFVLLLDEAHASGVFGPQGAGYAAEQGLESIVDVSLVTLSKALGLAGGAICGSADFCSAVANLGRAYIYSTALATPLAAAVPVALDILRSEPQRQARLRHWSAVVRARMADNGLHLPPGCAPILPVIVGQPQAALRAAQELHDAGMLVVAIRPPTVPAGTSRLRITLSSEHSDEQVEQLLGALARLGSTR